MSQQTETSRVSRPSRASITSEGTHLEAFHPRDWGLLFVAAGVWGSSFLSIAVAVEHFAPGVVTFGRISIGAVVLGLFKRARVTKIDRADWPRLAIVAVTWLAFPMTLFPIAQQHIASGLAGMLNGSIPLFTALIASIGLSRLPGKAQRLGWIVGALGIMFLGLPTLREGGSSAVGVLLVVIACSSYGVAVNVSIPLAQKYGSVPVFWRCQLLASVLTLPFALWGLHLSTWNARSGLALLSLGALGTAVAFIAMITLSARVGSTRGSSATFLEAVIALGLGVAFRHEHVQFLEGLGSVVLLVGAWLVSRADRA